MNEYERRLIQVTLEKSAQTTTIDSQSSSMNGLSSALVSESAQLSMPIAIVDVFTAIPFKGNQLAIVRVPQSSGLTQQAKQTIAKEFNFSETIFLHDSKSSSEQDMPIEIFTPTTELPFAGHPVIGAASYVCQHLERGSDSLIMSCKAGRLMARYDRKNEIAEVEVPANVRVHEQTVSGRALLKAQNYLSRTSIVMSEFPVVSFVKGMSFILVRLPSVQGYLEKVEADGTSIDISSVTLDQDFEPSFVGCYFYSIISQPDESPTRLRTRMIEPKIGEDSATGSAACTLASYLSLKEHKLGGTHHFAIEQGVEMGRKSDIRVRVTVATETNVIERVVLGGRAVLISQGSMRPPTNPTSH